MSVEIYLASEFYLNNEKPEEQEPRNLVTPGDVITKETGFMRGHGTNMQDEALRATVAGLVERVNKLISVRPLKSRYYGEIGDVVVGRITEVQQKRWKVDVNARLDAVLLLSSVNLPGGELRRRSAEDELAMRHYLQEGDLITAEVQNFFGDGAISLHTRSLKYGKLSQGSVVKVSPSLIKRRKTHFHNMPFGATVIFGNNGFIWLGPVTNEEIGSAGFVQNLKPLPLADREVIARLRNCVLALAQYDMMLYDTSVLHAYELSLKSGYENYVRYNKYCPKAFKFDQFILVRTQIELENA
nr:EOG090X09DD [Triops cancriformis]